MSETYDHVNVRYDYVAANSHSEALSKSRVSLGQVVGDKVVVAINAARMDSGYYALTYTFEQHDPAADIAAKTQFVFYVGGTSVQSSEELKACRRIS